MIKKIFFFLSICLLQIISLLPAHSQQDAQFSQYMNNQLFFNPAFAGVEGNMQANFTYRVQWLGYNPTFDPAGGNPTTQVFGFNTALKRLKSGVGFHIVNDNLGPLNNLEMQLSLAHHVKIKSAKLSIGVRGGLYAKSINFDRLRAIDPNDPLILTGRESEMVPDMAAGIYYKSNKWFGGLMVNHILPTDFNFGQNATGTPIILNPLAYASYGMVGYQYEINPMWQLNPSAIFKTNLNNFATFSYETSILATYNQKFWGGLSYRHQDAAIVLLGANIPYKKHTIRVGYSFDYIVFGTTAKQRTSHEITLAYVLPVKDPIPPTIIRTPRFRHNYLE